MPKPVALDQSAKCVVLDNVVGDDTTDSNLSLGSKSIWFRLGIPPEMVQEILSHNDSEDGSNMRAVLIRTETMRRSIIDNDAYLERRSLLKDFQKCMMLGSGDSVHHSVKLAASGSVQQQALSGEHETTEPPRAQMCERTCMPESTERTKSTSLESTKRQQREDPGVESVLLSALENIRSSDYCANEDVSGGEMTFNFVGRDGCQDDADVRDEPEHHLVDALCITQDIGGSRTAVVTASTNAGELKPLEHLLKVVETSPVWGAVGSNAMEGLWETVSTLKHVLFQIDAMRSRWDAAEKSLQARLDTASERLSRLEEMLQQQGPDDEKGSLLLDLRKAHNSLGEELQTARCKVSELQQLCQSQQESLMVEVEESLRTVEAVDMQEGSRAEWLERGVLSVVASGMLAVALGSLLYKRYTLI